MCEQANLLGTRFGPLEVLKFNFPITGEFD